MVKNNVSPGGAKYYGGLSVTVGCTVVVDTGVLGNLGERFLALPGTMGESELWLGTVERSELWLGTVKLGICMLSEEPRTPWVGWGCCTSGASWGSRTSAPRLQNSLQSPCCPGSSPSGWCCTRRCRPPANSCW